MSAPAAPKLSEFGPKLKTLLSNAMHRAIAQVRANHPDEEFYAFGLQVSDQGTYIEPLSCGQRGLKLAAAQFLADVPEAVEMYGSLFGSIRRTEETLRWSRDCAAWYLEERLPSFTETNTLLESINPYILGLHQHDDSILFHYCDELDRIVMGATVSALCDLDNRGDFGEGRNRVVVLLDRNDETNENRIQNALQVNPPSVLNQFIADLREEERRWARNSASG